MDILDQVESHLTVSNIGIQEFVESENFCNKQIYPRQRVLLKLFFLEELTSFEEGILDFWIAGGRGGNEITISPNIRERVQYLRDAGFSHFREIVLVGGRRSSKGWVTGVAMAKVLWDTLQLQDPGRHYGIDPEKEIYYSCVAGSEAQAKEFQFADFVSSVESCKAFEPYLVKTLETEFRVATSEDLRKTSQAKKRGGKIQRDIAKLRGKALAANAGTLRGSATMAICLDEVAWMVPGVSKASADQVYGAANPSLDQFGKDALLFLNSSPYSKVGLFYERFEAALTGFDPKRPAGDDTNGNPLMMTLQYPSWALFEGYDKDPERRFRKAITVSADWDPDEKKEDGSNKYSGDDQQQILIARTEESANPEKYKVERRGKFAEVTDAYLNPEMVNRAFEGVPVGHDEEGRVLLKPLATNWGYGATNLFKYKAHLDPSSTTAGFGFALGHVEMFSNPQGVPEEHVVFDIVKRWDPKTFPGESIDWRIVITEVMGYLELFRPYELTLDQFQSSEPIQHLQYLLQDRGIGGIIVRELVATAENNWNRAETYKTALNHGRIHYPNDTEDLELASHELKFLQQRNTGSKYPKVDKQYVGPVQTDDMADCAQEVVSALIGNIIAQQMRERSLNAVMSHGAQGGFRIGGKQRPSLTELHPNLSGYYSKGREGEQSRVEYNTSPQRGKLGGGRRGMNRGGGRK